MTIFVDFLCDASAIFLLQLKDTFMSKLWSTFHGKHKTYASAFYQNISGVEVVRRNVPKKKNSTDLTAKQIEACAINSKFVNFATRHNNISPVVIAIFVVEQPDLTSIALSVCAKRRQNAAQKAQHFKEAIMPYLQVVQNLYDQKDKVLTATFRESELWPKFAIASLAPHLHSLAGSTPVTQYRYDIFFILLHLIILRRVSFLNLHSQHASIGAEAFARALLWWKLGGCYDRDGTFIPNK